ncbi:transporter substrate-binding domain-containing protein [Simiduia sp. 21SJ11W-1]|uniref:substrate-binding periplasmic protein n=1 Tax=Simiduia sp. 21SJ11W-1 TaxID=2909669 RepID=UPI00209DDF56|nr:transporter substrate-binding domain-containing protein [Simiduia sp. 21SJ11W-1]UTA46414.1 transporter substrate-binding domain-containing protein [Simiduia sp. 21SJ11W-1]
MHLPLPLLSRASLLAALLGWAQSVATQAQPPRAASDSTTGAAIHASEIVIRMPKEEFSNSGHTNYIRTLLQLALIRSKSAHETITLAPIEEDLTQARLIAELQRGHILDIIWTMTSREREATMLPVRIPLLKGLLGQRVFLIRADRQADFEKVSTLSELTEFTAGQGAHWPDTEILRANGLPVLTSTRYELLFSMLRGGRFDYFPRGVNEAWAELDAHPNEGLTVESTLLLSYPAPMYFFVRKGNEALAKRLEQGLELMIADGSLDALIESHPSLMQFVKKADVKSRKVFKLNNPDLPAETPLHQPKYWAIEH